MSTLHPLFAEALKPFAPPAVSSHSKTIGSMHTSTFRGADLDAVCDAADDFKTRVDPYRSPAVKAQYWDGEAWVVEVRYYGLD